MVLLMVESRAVVIDVIRTTFGFEGDIRDDMVTDDVDGWDSLGHVTVILMIERRLGISISESERDGLADLGELFALVERKMSGA